MSTRRGKIFRLDPKVLTEFCRLHVNNFPKDGEVIAACKSSLTERAIGLLVISSSCPTVPEGVPWPEAIAVLKRTREPA